MTQQFTDEDFKALSAHAAKLAQEQQQEQPPVVQAPPMPASIPAPAPAPAQLSNRTLIVGAVGGGVILLMALGAIAGIMQRPSQPQAAATPSPSLAPVVEASPMPSPLPSPSPSPVAVPTHVVWGNPGGILNIRSEASTDGEVIGGIPADSQIVVTGYEGRWAITSWDGVTGYVSQKFLTPIGQDKSSP